MKLWLLRPNPESTLWETWYDKAFGFVVRAETAEQARALAQQECGDEGYVPGSGWSDRIDAWTNPDHSSCNELTPDGEAEIVIRDFHAA